MSGTEINFTLNLCCYESSFLVAVLIYLYNMFGVTLVYGIISFFLLLITWDSGLHIFPHIHLFHCYADDTVIYLRFSSSNPWTAAFDVVQSHLTQFKSRKIQIQIRLFSNSKPLTYNLSKISTFQGVEIKLVTTYKYWVIISQSFSFKSHIENLVSKLKLKIRFLNF